MNVNYKLNLFLLHLNAILTPYVCFYGCISHLKKSGLMAQCFEKIILFSNLYIPKSNQ
jgi:hypothetical protein